MKPFLYCPLCGNQVRTTQIGNPFIAYLDCDKISIKTNRFSLPHFWQRLSVDGTEIDLVTYLAIINNKLIKLQVNYYENVSCIFESGHYSDGIHINQIITCRSETDFLNKIKIYSLFS
jgi:hypothetical protein